MSTSRLTVSPGCLRPRVVRASVSGIRLTSIQPGPPFELTPGEPTPCGLTPPSADTVRLTPSTAIDPFSTT